MLTIMQNNSSISSLATILTFAFKNIIIAPPNFTLLFIIHNNNASISHLNTNKNKAFQKKR